MMNMSESPMQQAVSEIMAETADVESNGDKNTYFSITTTIHTDADEPIESTKTISLDTIRDYRTEVGEQVYISCIIGLGDYVMDVYPYKDNLEVTIKLKPVKASTGKESDDKNIIATRYKALFDDSENPAVDTADFQNLDKFTLNTTSVITLKLQLVDRALESLRTLKCGGVFKKTTNGNLIMGLTAETASGMEAEGEAVLDAVEMVEPDNTEEKEQMVIPQGTLLIDLAQYIQKNEGGLYNADVGNFIQRYNGKVTWFIYPKFNNLRFDGENNAKINKAKALIYSIPSAQYFGITKTYCVNGDTIKILAINNKKNKNDGETSIVDQGVGFTSVDADSIMDKNIEMTENGPKAKPNQTTSNVSLKDKADSLNFIPESNSRITSNQFNQASQQIVKTGTPMYIEWPYGDPDILYPGMPVKYIFLDGVSGKMERIEVTGTLLKVQTTVQPNEKGWSSRFMITVCGLGIFVDKVDKTKVYGASGSSSSSQGSQGGGGSSSGGGIGAFFKKLIS